MLRHEATSDPVSDDSKKQPDDDELVQHYQRRGGSARKDEPRGGLWQRVREWVGTDAKDKDKGEDAPAEPDG